MDRAVANVRTEGAAEVGSHALRRPLRAARFPPRRGDQQPGKEPADGGELLRVAVGEVLGAQELEVGGRVSDVAGVCLALCARDCPGSVKGRLSLVDHRSTGAGDDESVSRLSEEVTSER